MKSSVMKLCAFDLIIILIKQVSCTPKLSGICGDPGRPVGSQITPLQSIYSEDDSVVYKCDDYISIKYTKTCVKGEWIGIDAVCGKSLKDNDLKSARIINKTTNKIIREYNTSNSLSNFTKFGNSFIAERYSIPLRAYGSMSYVFKLYMQYKGLFELVRLSLSVVYRLTNEAIRNSTFNITKVITSKYRKCVLISTNTVSPWFHNSTRFDYCYHCLSPNLAQFRKELVDMSDTIIIETESDTVIQLDLATFIIAQSYTNNGNFHEPICGTPEVPIGFESNVIHHHSEYTFKCAQRFDQSDETLADTRLVCGINMKWIGSLPNCYPLTKCKKFELNSDSLVQIDSYEKVYYRNSTEWFAIDGTTANFRCTNAAHILVGKQSLVCGAQNKWSENVPTCYNPYESLSVQTVILIGVIILIVIIILSAILIYCLVRNRAAKNSKTVENELRTSIYDDMNVNNTYEDLYANDKMYAEYYASQNSPTDKVRYHTAAQTSNKSNLVKVTYVNTEGDQTYVNEDIAGAYVTMH